MKVTLHIKDNVLCHEKYMDMFVHAVKRIIGYKKNDTLMYSYIQDNDTGLLQKAYIVFNINDHDKNNILSNLQAELGDYIYSINAKRGDLVLTEDTGTDFD